MRYDLPSGDVQAVRVSLMNVRGAMSCATTELHGNTDHWDESDDLGKRTLFHTTFVLSNDNIPSSYDNRFLRMHRSLQGKTKRVCVETVKAAVVRQDRLCCNK